MSSNRDKTLWVWLAACAVLCLGTGWTLYHVRSTPAQVAKIERKIRDLEALRVMQQQVGSHDQAVSAFDALSSKHAPSLASLLQQAAPGLVADVRERESGNVVSGWTLRRADVMFNDVPLDGVGRFLQSAEKQRPPWRLSECHVTASETMDGAGRVTLVLEALEKPNAL